MIILAMNGLIGLFVLSACTPPVLDPCIEGARCTTSDPCTSGEMRCGVDGRGYCVATEYAPGCPRTDPVSCIEGARCTTGDPCTSGKVRCGVDGRSHCIAVELAPGCPAPTPIACVEGAVCATGDPCTSGDLCEEGVCQPGATDLCQSCSPKKTVSCGDINNWNTELEGATTYVDTYACSTTTFSGPMPWMVMSCGRYQGRFSPVEGA